MKFYPSAESHLRQWLRRWVFPQRGESAQRVAGEASAQSATTAFTAGPTLPELSDAELSSGHASLSGAWAANDGQRLVNAPDPDIPQDATAAAFFDVDNTLIKGASLLLFARGLARRRIFSFGQVCSFVWRQLKFTMSGTENAKDIATGREQALSIVKGYKESEVKDLAREVWQQTLARRVFPGVHELARTHLAAGQQVWLVTASPVQLAQVIARELGFTGALGTVAEVKDGVFTGRLTGDILHGPGKRFAVVALARELDLDLSRCTAYSDSYNDLPLLFLVGNPVPVNADAKLRRAAKDFGWKVYDYRKRGSKRFTIGTPVAVAGAIALGGGVAVILRRK